jgi:hypothetical protein
MNSKAAQRIGPSWSILWHKRPCFSAESQTDVCAHRICAAGRRSRRRCARGRLRCWR